MRTSRQAGGMASFSILFFSFLLIDWAFPLPTLIGRPFRGRLIVKSSISIFRSFVCGIARNYAVTNQATRRLMRAPKIAMLATNSWAELDPSQAPMERSVSSACH